MHVLIAFITIGVESGMKQLLEFGLFHGDPHPVRLALYSSIAQRMY
jgi:predicted unusual protein kinase regulating ubiquinone biosynthesis (AarF/ABC1/UbiB family)